VRVWKGLPAPGCVVASLAGAVQDAIAALYNLQAAVVIEEKISNTLFYQLGECRVGFVANWEGYIQFLRRCHGYANDFIALCKYVSRWRSQSVVPSRELLVDAKRLPADAQILRNKHEKPFTELRIKADAIDHELALGPNPLDITGPNELVQESPNIFAR
jgi:hypothetical protein